ncbi:hypothetical protein ATM17_22260 [Sphingopyxis macrogoltabida]|uniref:Uncharacterized protein n=2 Tax=Sphingopyxis macrogoltabida TaxID=33050 RepID=A0AAC9FGR9_SPHMC|nr:hypothetical protein LH19_21700 [Sphingopyxis macrogoltabida]AMU91740.1 hypothetical protein ATM17_22260 [Sphingopyxis macrogoltabida]
MVVGEKCCNDLTEGTVGTESHADFLNFLDRRKRFVGSSKWQANNDGSLSIRRSGIAILIVMTAPGQFRFHLDEAHGKVDHPTILDAKISAFDFVESGKAAAYLAERLQRAKSASHRSQ